MQELQLFTHDRFGNLRAVEIDGEPWFVGKDVATALGYSNTKDALAAHVDPEDKRQGDGVAIRDPMGREQHPTVINESGLYSLVLSSRLDGAKVFKRWITKEVIPSIRKTGGYVGNDELFIHTYLPNADEATRALFLSTLQTVRSLNSKIDEDKPKVLFADAVTTAKTSILIGELAKLLKQNGVESMGQNRLFQWMRNKGYLIKRRGSDFNMPTQRSMEMGLFEIKETAVTHSDGHTVVNKTPKVTGKGQQYFINQFLRKTGGGGTT